MTKNEEYLRGATDDDYRPGFIKDLSCDDFDVVRKPIMSPTVKFMVIPMSEELNPKLSKFAKLKRLVLRSFVVEAVPYGADIMRKIPAKYPEVESLIKAMKEHIRLLASLYDDDEELHDKLISKKTAEELIKHCTKSVTKFECLECHSIKGRRIFAYAEKSKSRDQEFYKFDVCQCGKIWWYVETKAHWADRYF